MDLGCLRGAVVVDALGREHALPLLGNFIPDIEIYDLPYIYIVLLYRQQTATD
jgi:hypothetical protein